MNFFSNIIFTASFALLVGCKYSGYESSVVGFGKLDSQSKICVLGDSGTGHWPQFWVAKALEREGCDLIVHVGDIIYPNSLENAEVEKTLVDPYFRDRFHGPYYKLLDEQKIPFYMVIGNHEYWGNPHGWLNLAKGEKFKNKIMLPEFYYAARSGDVCAIFLETNTRYNKQKKWFGEVLQDFSKSCKYSFAFGHHPYLSSGDHGDATGARKILLDELVVGHFDVYVSGHEHLLSEEGDRKGTRLLISGGGGAWTRPIQGEPTWGASKYGYLVFQISSGSIDYKFKVAESESKTIVAHSGRIKAKGIR